MCDIVPNNQLSFVIVFLQINRLQRNSSRKATKLDGIVNK